MNKNDSVKEESVNAYYTLLCRIDELTEANKAANAVIGAQADELQKIIFGLQVENAALREESMWIPVSECLPAIGEYLVLSSTGYRTILNFDGSYWFSDGGAQDDYWSNFITHWRPLPTPPKPTDDAPTTSGVSPTPPPSEVAHAPKSD